MNVDYRHCRADQAIVELLKLEGYALNAAHLAGRHKARVFAAVFGLTVDDAPFLRDKLLEIVRTHEAVETEPGVYGRRFTIDFELETSKGKGIVRSAWIIRTSEDIPRLTSCYVLNR